MNKSKHIGLPCLEPECNQPVSAECPVCGAPLCEAHLKDCRLCRTINETVTLFNDEFAAISAELGKEINYQTIETYWDEVKPVADRIAPNISFWMNEADSDLYNYDSQREEKNFLE